MLLLIPMEYQNVLHNIYDTHIKVFYGKCSNTFVNSIISLYDFFLRNEDKEKIVFGSA